MIKCATFFGYLKIVCELITRTRLQKNVPQKMAISDDDKLKA